MKPFLSRLIILLALVSVFLFLPGVTQAQEAAPLDVAVAAICQDVVDREPVDTKITGAQEATQITHVWYFGAEERARVDLDVTSATWRTWSSKIIQTHEIGSWRVDVLDPAGTVLKELKFEITE